METLAKTRRLMAKRVVRRYRVRKSAVSVGRRVMMFMSGGPIDRLMMHSSGTLPFSLQGMRGYYDNENRWVEL